MTSSDFQPRDLVTLERPPNIRIQVFFLLRADLVKSTHLLKSGRDSSCHLVAQHETWMLFFPSLIEPTNSSEFAAPTRHHGHASRDVGRNAGARPFSSDCAAKVLGALLCVGSSVVFACGRAADQPETRISSCGSCSVLRFLQRSSCLERPRCRDGFSVAFSPRLSGTDARGGHSSVALPRSASWR